MDIKKKTSVILPLHRKALSLCRYRIKYPAATLTKLFSTCLGAEIGIKTTLPLHLCLEVGQLGNRHVDVAAADVRCVSEIRGHADHAPVYPEPLMRPATVPPVVPRWPWRQAARETLHPELVVASHLSHVSTRITGQSPDNPEGNSKAPRFNPGRAARRE